MTAMTRPATCLIAATIALLAQEPPETTVTFGTTVVISSGLEGRIYHIREDSQKLPDFRKMKPVGKIYTTSLNVPAQDFKVGFPGVTKRFEWFAIDYTGRFWAEKPGYYEFALTSDDGSNLYIDQEVVIDNDGIHSAVERTGSVQLKKGVHDIRVSYFQGPGTQLALVLKVAPPREEMRIFSTEELKPPPAP
jgi:PA14 domain-containing protein